MPLEAIATGNPRRGLMWNGIGSGFFLSVTLAYALAACAERTRVSGSADDDGSAAAGVQRWDEAMVVPNDNRMPAGVLREGTLDLRLEARSVSWRPDNDTANTPTVLAFAEEGRRPSIPGPLIRVPQGTEVRITVRNSIPESAHVGLPPNRQRDGVTSSFAGPELTVHGLRAGTVPNDFLHIPRGTVREVRFRADEPGTFLYWGAMSRRGLDVRTGADAQLTGAIVVDPIGSTPDPDERLFVITMTDAFPDSTVSPPGENVFEPVINGLSWPHTDRLQYAVGEVVRWRWVNGSFSEHPMHLHGFHFRTLARGDGVHETTYPASETSLAVTELMEPGSTFRMEWTPTRAGNWLMHCHLLDHIAPIPERDERMRAHGHDDVTNHALSAMAGLVLGITVSEKRASVVEPRAHRQLWLVAREEAVHGSAAIIRGFAVQFAPGPSVDAPTVPGPPVILTRRETTSIIVVNQMSEPTTVHWHGMELESVYDGVAGWSRTGSRVAPLVAPRDSFTVQITPPRAGTFIYHTHMDETDQLIGGMYGPLLVLEPGERFDPEIDRLFVIGGAVHNGEYSHATINGQLQPAAQRFRAGTTYRLRFINISPDATVELTLAQNGVPHRWIGLANDGAELPPPLRVDRVARLRFGPGQTYDFNWTPTSPGNATLVLDWPFPTESGNLTLRQVFHVR
ncbi:MAG: multicopper oxidase domain-containing protein [Gemmatimonadaceae bacterium]